MDAADLPPLNQPVRIRTWDGDGVASRIEGIAGGRITIARPFDLHAEDEVGGGAELLLSWVFSRGLVVLPVRLAGTRRENSVELWDLDVAGEAWHEQRREYVRVPVTGPVQLRAPDGPVDGYLVDVGEAALQCSVPRTPETTALLAEGTPVSCLFTLREADFELAGQVTAHRLDYPAPDRVAVIAAFEPTPQQAQALRRAIYAQQLHTRHP